MDNQNNNGNQSDDQQAPVQTPSMPQQPSTPTGGGMGDMPAGGGMPTPPVGGMGEPTAPSVPTGETPMGGGMPTPPVGGVGDAPAGGMPAGDAPVGGPSPMGGDMSTGGATTPAGMPQGQPGDDQSGATE